MSGVRQWGFWTEQKLDILSGYLRGFLTATKAATHRLYVDTHAGQGEAESKHDGVRIKTSAVIAKEALDSRGERGFEQLVFIELVHAEKLAAKVDAEHDTRIAVHAGDCDHVLPGILEGIKPHDGSHVYWPTVVFVDPDGVKDLKWNTLETVAHFKSGERPDGKPVQKAELYFLFSDVGIARIFASEAKDETLQHITDALGTAGWKSIRERYQADEIDYYTLCNELTNLMRWRLENALGYRYTHALPFRNTTNADVYQMIFATDNAAGSGIIEHLYRKHAQKMPELRRGAIDRASGQQTLDFGDLQVENREQITYAHIPPVDPNPAQRG